MGSVAHPGALALAVLVAAPAFARSGPLFGNQRLNAGFGPTALAAADIDGDGDTDLIVASTQNDSVFIALNDGFGRFVNAYLDGIFIGDEPIDVLAADVDADDDVDVITINRLDGALGIMLNDGGGGLAAPVVHPVPGGVFGDAAAADLDGDGDIDVAVPNESSDTAAIMLNDGNGAFTFSDTIGPIDGPLMVIATDLDADDVIDLAVGGGCDPFSCGGGHVTVFLNDGAATFTLNSFTTVSNGLTGMIAVDLEDDGDGDLLTCSINQFMIWGHVVALTNDGTGTMTGQLVAGASGAVARTVTAGDIDGDGVVDLIVADSGNGDCPEDRLLTYLGIGDGFYAQPVQLDVGDAPWDLLLEDLDADGDPDLALIEQGDPFSHECVEGNLRVLLNDGSGRFGALRKHRMIDEPTDVAVADVDGTPGVDLIAIDAGSSDVLIWSNDGNGGFDDFVSYDVGERPFTLQVADVTGDGLDDVITANLFGDSVSILPALADGGFDTHVELPVSARPIGVRVGDLDGDDDPDIVVSHNRATGPMSVLINLGGGVFGVPIIVPTPEWPTMLTLDDLDGDDDLDVALAIAEGLVTIYTNTAGVLTQGASISVGEFPVPITSGDLNGDGAIDIVTGNLNVDQVTVLLNDGHGGFAAQPPIDVADEPYAVHLDDLDGDGDLDIALGWAGGAFEGSAECYAGGVQVLRNDGGGVLTVDSNDDGGFWPTALTSADFHGDGRRSLVVGSTWNPPLCIEASVSILPPVSGGPCPTDLDRSGTIGVDDLVAVILAWGACPPGPCPADIDGSGAVEIDDLLAVILAWGPCG